jgi:hypothetical protein
MNFYLYYYYFFFGLFAIVLYMMALDPNVGRFIVLMSKVARLSVARGIFWLKFYPRLRLDTAKMKWKANQTLKKNLKKSDK